MYTCPFCRAEVPGRGFCPNCNLGLGFDAEGRLVPFLPEIRPGALVDRWDFSREPFPSSESREGDLSGDPMLAVEDGILLKLSKGTQMLTAPLSRLRDGCVSAEFTARHAAVNLGVFFRHESTETARTMYAFWASPGSGKAQLLRRFASAGGAGGNARVPITERPLPRGAVKTGQRHRVELRVRGTTLHGLLDGAPVLSAHDPYLGAGMPGIYLQVEETPSKPVEVTCHALELYEVSP